MIKIIIADDHHIMLDGIASLVEYDDAVEVVGVATNGDEVISILKQRDVDLVVSDITMPIMNGIELTKYVKSHFPHIKVLILSMWNTLEYIDEAIEAGADGYILKENGQEELGKAIRRIADGKSYFSEKVFELILNGHKKKVKLSVQLEVSLTPREIDVLKLIVEGNTTKMISEKLFIADTTVTTHRKHLMVKTGVANSSELVRFALENGYV